MKFICTRQMGLDGSVIYPGIYEAELDEEFGYFIIKKTQGRDESANLLSFKDDLLKCGYFDTWKYCFSHGQSDGGLEINYVLVNGNWEPYSECMRGKFESNWEDMVIIAESEEKLPTRFSAYTLMEMRENWNLFG